MLNLAAITPEGVTHFTLTDAIQQIRMQCRDIFLKELSIRSEQEYIESGLESIIVPVRYRQGYAAFLRNLAKWIPSYSFMLALSSRLESDPDGSEVGVNSIRAVELMADAGLPHLSDAECLAVQLMRNKATTRISMADRLWLVEQFEELHDRGLLVCSNLEQLSGRILSANVSALLVQGGLSNEDCAARDAWGLTTMLRWLGSVDDREPIFNNDSLTATECYSLLCGTRYDTTLFSRQTIRQKRVIGCHGVQDVLHSATMSPQPSIAG